MTQKDKELLLKDLNARLPYGVKILHKTWNYEWDQEMTLLERVVGIDEEFIYVKVINTHNGEEYKDDKIYIDTFDDKIFLRPMSSMTEEERKELSDYLCEQVMSNKIGITIPPNPTQGKGIPFIWMGDCLEWLNAHNFDHRGLIEKGLALEAPKDMYKI